MSTQKPCRQFVPDTNSLSSFVAEEETFIQLSEIMSVLDDGQLRKLGALMMREKQTRSAGYHMGQRVYVRYRGLARANYLSNFLIAYIMYADQDVVRVCSRDGKRTMTFAGRARDAVMSAEEFEPIRKRMIKNQRFADPDVQKQVSRHLRTLEEHELGLSDKIDYGEIPTIDKVFRANKVKRNKNVPNDLVGIVSAIEKGFEVPKTKVTKRKKVKEKVGENGVKEYSVS